MERGLLAFVSLVYIDGDAGFVRNFKQHTQIDRGIFNTGVVKWSRLVDVIECDQGGTVLQKELKRNVFVRQKNAERKKESNGNTTQTHKTLYM